MMTRQTQLAIERAGFKRIGEEIGLTRQAVYNWVQNKRVPAEHVRTIAPLIGLEPWQIRPDLYDAPERCDA